MNILDCLGREQLPDRCIRLAGRGNRGIEHHVVPIECTQRKQPAVERWRDDILEAFLLRTFTDKDGMSGGIWSRNDASVIEKQHSSALLHVIETDPARK